MVVTEDGHMVTGRQEPRLVLVSLTCEGGCICLNGPDMEELRFPIKQPNNPVIDCRVFGADIQGQNCGDEPSRWLTRYLGQKKTFRLVHFEPQLKARKPVESEKPFPQYVVAYTDVGPVMLLSEASVERFRPNIVISDCEAFAEDSWEEIQIGSVRLQRVMSCGRCVFTTVDPETGVITRKEPLDTLKSYRLCKPSEKHIYKSSPLFGQLHTVKKTGILQVGDVESPALSEQFNMELKELKELVGSALVNNKKAAFLIGTGVAVLGLGYKYLGKPEKLVRVGVVSQLLVHPLKSGKAVSVALAECLSMGLKFGELQDRHWMVVTEDGHMVTGRQEPRLVLVSLTCEGGYICLNGPDMEELRFPIKQPDNPVIDCRVLGADIQGQDYGDEPSRWLTRYLGEEKTFRLVHFEPQMKARNSVEIEPLFPQYEVAYSDVAPVMLLSESSVKDLSSKLEKDVTVERFRPNIVISDCEAFAEDSWENIQIGSVRLQRVMSCGRCVFTTVDPETGVITRKEPLDTLKSYRLCKPSEKHIYKSEPLFGQLHTVKKTGILQVGDVVYKISR